MTDHWPHYKYVQEADRPVEKWYGAKLRCLPPGTGGNATEPELFPTDGQIAVCLWDGLNYVQSNGAHIQCYLQIPPEQPLSPEKKKRRLTTFVISKLSFRRNSFLENRRLKEDDMWIISDEKHRCTPIYKKTYFIPNLLFHLTINNNKHNLYYSFWTFMKSIGHFFISLLYGHK